MDELLAAVARFVHAEVRPAAAAHDRDDSYPHELVQQMQTMGLFGLTIDERYGGLGLSPVAYAQIVEELASGWASVPGLLNSHLVVAYLISAHGSDAQREHWLPLMATGAVRGALLLTEPHAGSDLKAIRSLVAGLKLSGQKTMITNGRHASLYAVLARRDDAIDLYLLPTERPGIAVGREIEKMGFRGLEMVEVFFEQVPIEEQDLLGQRGHGISTVLDALELGRIAIAASAVGVARAAFDEALTYARCRVAFGRPIAQLQAVQLHLSEMYTRISAARALVYEAANAKQRGRADLESGVAKYYASETALFVATTAMRVLGGYGYLKEYPIERYFRDAPIFIVGEGTNEVLRTEIARRLVDRLAQ